LLVAIVIAGAHAGASGDTNPQLRGSPSKEEKVTLHVSSKAPFPIVLASCEGNRTVPALQDYTSGITVSGSSFFWVVPAGVAWDCKSGCPECFFLAWSLDASGGLVARIGYETSDNDDQGEAFDLNASGALRNTTSMHGGEAKESNFTITGVELVVTQSSDGKRVSSICGESRCQPNWERDQAVAWDSTIDLLIRGSKQVNPAADAATVMLLGHWGGYHGIGYRPPVWRRPVWHRPIYHPVYCTPCTPYCWRYWCR